MYKTTKVLLGTLVLGLSISLMPFVAFGAYNDVTLTTDTVITVGGINLNISGSSAVVQSIIVNADNFTFVLLDNSTVTVSSSDKRVLAPSVSGGLYTTSASCSSSASVTTFSSYNNGSTVTVTVTPTSSTCTLSTLSSSSGGSSHRINANPVAPAITNTTTIAEIKALIAKLKAQIAIMQTNPSLEAVTTSASLNTSFKHNLSSGLKGEDVKNLQKFLNSQGFLIAETGDGSTGKETITFGTLTKAALIKFQKANGIDAIGIMGPITRAKIQSLTK